MVNVTMVQRIQLDAGNWKTFFLDLDSVVTTSNKNDYSREKRGHYDIQYCTVP